MSVHYTEDFKKEVVKAYMAGDKSIPQIAVEFNDSETEFLRTVINIMDQKHVITDNILDFVELIQN